MDTIETLKAENERLKAQNTEMIEKAKLRNGGAIFGGGPVGKVSRDVFQAMSPGARAGFSKAGGIVAD